MGRGERGWHSAVEGGGMYLKGNIKKLNILRCHIVYLKDNAL